MATTTEQPNSLDFDRQSSPSPARRPALLLAVAAGLCWACALAMLLSANLDNVNGLLAPARMIFYALVLAAGLLTFAPFQRRLGLPGLAFEGVAGSFLLLYTLAFVPPPTAWLLALPDATVYMLLALGLFWSISAAAMPPIYALGRRVFRERARQYDLRRARRQAHELGLLAALCVGLAGLRVLTPVPVLLLALILGVAELLFLSFVETET
ncbi:MAG TPA: hypothetical protein VKE41_17155 [Roseiflexaceae bacterium]|nr:hypothetical protein [Roseiflexaceae bacterium]